MKQLRNEVIEYIHRNNEINILQALDTMYFNAFNITLSELDILVANIKWDDYELLS